MPIQPPPEQSQRLCYLLFDPLHAHALDRCNLGIAEAIDPVEHENLSRLRLEMKHGRVDTRDAIAGFQMEMRIRPRDALLVKLHMSCLMCRFSGSVSHQIVRHPVEIGFGIIETEMGLRLRAQQPAEGFLHEIGDILRSDTAREEARQPRAQRAVQRVDIGPRRIANPVVGGQGIVERHDDAPAQQSIECRSVPSKR